MKISGQNFDIKGDHLIMKLRDPFWSAWQRFGWEEGVEGYSVSNNAVQFALKNNLKILIKTKYANYEITPTLAVKYGRTMPARGGTLLICIPRTKLWKYECEHKNTVDAGDSEHRIIFCTDCGKELK